MMVAALAISLEALPADRIAADNKPGIIRSAQPVYPREALRTGLEGEVQVKVLVGIDGKPRKVAILKSDSEVFNQASIDAAKQFLFSPAYIRDKPVAVWVTVPFRYKLADKKDSQ